VLWLLVLIDHQLSDTCYRGILGGGPGARKIYIVKD
jgi:hypothetical protein